MVCERVMLVTSSECPRKVSTHLPVLISQILHVLFEGEEVVQPAHCKDDDLLIDGTCCTEIAGELELSA